MKTIGAIVFFILICAISALLFLDSIPVLVHRTAPELDRTLLILVGLSVLALAWWFASGRRWRVAAVGWTVLAIPFASHAIWQTEVLLADYRGARLPDRMAIENYRETPIFWDGFEDPVGLTLEFELVHPPDLGGIVFTPQIRMAPHYDIAAEDLQSARTFSNGYFKDNYFGVDVGDLVILKPVLFQDIYENTPPDTDVDFLDASGRTRLVYHLHAGTVAQLASRDNICLVSPSVGLPTCADNEDASDGCVGDFTRKVTDVTYNIGTDVTALWTASGGSYRNADLSALLTDVLRRESSLQGDVAAWRALHRQFEPAQLATRGYQKCPPGPASHGIGRVCYCRR